MFDAVSEFETRTKPDNTPDTIPSGFAALFSNPQFLSLLAGAGAKLDPQGVGGALGGATQNILNQQALQKTAARTEDLQNKRHAEILAAFARMHTPAGAEGPTATTVSGNKIITKGNRGDTEYTETQPVPAIVPPITTTPTSPTVPAAGVSTSPQTSIVPAITPRNETRAFLPFSRALLG